MKATCGHILREDEELGVLVRSQEWDQYGNPLIHEGRYCPRCATYMYNKGTVLNPDEVEQQLKDTYNRRMAV